MLKKNKLFKIFYVRVWYHFVRDKEKSPQTFKPDKTDNAVSIKNIY